MLTDALSWPVERERERERESISPDYVSVAVFLWSRSIVFLPINFYLSMYPITVLLSLISLLLNRLLNCPVTMTDLMSNYIQNKLTDDVVF